MKNVRKPTATHETMIIAQMNMVSLLRSTAFTLVMTAVIASVLRSMIIGSENALALKEIHSEMYSTSGDYDLLLKYGLHRFFSFRRAGVEDLLKLMQVAPETADSPDTSDGGSGTTAQEPGSDAVDAR